MAAVLLVGASAHAAAAALVKFTGLPGWAIQGALEAAQYPFSMTGKQGNSAVAITRRANRMYRAAFVVNAARRIKQAGQNNVAQSVDREKTWWQSHTLAQNRRLLVARNVDIQATQFGPLLGWYSVDDTHTSAECRAANGRNFYVVQPPVIGWPGAVHPHCRCTAGPPHPGAKMVNASLTVAHSDEASGFYPKG